MVFMAMSGIFPTISQKSEEENTWEVEHTVAHLSQLLHLIFKLESQHTRLQSHQYEKQSYLNASQGAGVVHSQISSQFMANHVCGPVLVDTLRNPLVESLSGCPHDIATCLVTVGVGHNEFTLEVTSKDDLVHCR